MGWGCPNPLKEILPELFQNLGDGQQKLEKLFIDGQNPAWNLIYRSFSFSLSYRMVPLLLRSY